jgi:hypothetical protein
VSESATFKGVASRLDAIAAEQESRAEAFICSHDSPIEREVLRRIRNRVREIERADAETFEDLILNGDGSLPPTNIIKANPCRP